MVLFGNGNLLGDACSLVDKSLNLLINAVNFATQVADLVGV